MPSLRCQPFSATENPISIPTQFHAIAALVPNQPTAPTEVYLAESLGGRGSRLTGILRVAYSRRQLVNDARTYEVVDSVLHLPRKA